jgi:MOSC domain-containing protein YiiM
VSSKAQTAELHMSHSIENLNAPAVSQPPGLVFSVNVSAIRTVPVLARSRQVTTGIYKKPVMGRMQVRGVNIAGDEQADRENHGGPHKAVYAYANEDYEWFSTQYSRRFLPGDFGENLTTVQVDVTHAVIGEHWKIGSAEFEVSEPRIPCYKLGLKLNDPAFPAAFAKALRPGAYLRIIKEGELGASDSVQIISRPDHGVTVSDVAEAYLFDHRLFPRLLKVPQLRSDWHDRARQAGAA